MMLNGLMARSENDEERIDWAFFIFDDLQLGSRTGRSRRRARRAD
jgi:hypothetical protein